MSPRVYLYIQTCTIPAIPLLLCPLGRDRTYDRLLKRELLYQLSYERILNYYKNSFRVINNLTSHKSFVCPGEDSVTNH